MNTTQRLHAVRLTPVTSGAIASTDIASHIGAKHTGASVQVGSVTTLDRPMRGALAFCNREGADLSGWAEMGGCLVAPAGVQVPADCAHVVTVSPRLDFGRLVQAFFAPPRPTGVETTAQIHPSVSIPSTSYIGHFAVLEEGVQIGENTVVGHHCTLHAGTLVGNQVSIGANTVLGSVGFGLEEDESGEWVRIPHIGRVVVEDQVEIGASTVIARGTIFETRIGRNTKIDDQVFIAHNAQVGENCTIIAQAEVSGSVVIGRDTWIGPAATIIQQVEIGSNSLVGIGAVVTKNVPSNVVVAGNPARVIRER